MAETDTGARRTTHQAWHHVRRQPNWVIRGTGAVFFACLLLPLLGILLTAALVAFVAFVLFLCAHWVTGKVRGTQGDGRHNVRVIQNK